MENMIKLKNDHELNYVIASGALSYDGKGWLWEKPLYKLGLIRPSFFSIVIKTITLDPHNGNLRWWKPWTCIRHLPDGSILNKIGLTNPGAKWWFQKIGNKINKEKMNLIGSIQGTQNELIELTKMFNNIDVVAIEINTSCPNIKLNNTQDIIDNVKAVKKVSRHPIIVKVSVVQDYIAITNALYGIIEAVDLNSVPWERVYPHIQSPLCKSKNELGGGISGKGAQNENWKAAYRLKMLTSTPVIFPSIVSWEDIEEVQEMGADAISFGSIHLPSKWKPWTLFTNPCKPTMWVKRLNQKC
jgi:dihydroorotate dehydrogenase